MLFAYMAGGEGVGVRGFKLFCQGGGGSEFFRLALCVGGWVGGQVQYLSFREKNNRPLLLINDWSQDTSFGYNIGCKHSLHLENGL